MRVYPCVRARCVSEHACMRMRVCVRTYARARVRARACVRVRVRAWDEGRREGARKGGGRRGPPAPAEAHKAASPSAHAHTLRHTHSEASIAPCVECIPFSQLSAQICAAALYCALATPPPQHAAAARSRARTNANSSLPPSRPPAPLRPPPRPAHLRLPDFAHGLARRPRPAWPGPERHAKGGDGGRGEMGGPEALARCRVDGVHRPSRRRDQPPAGPPRALLGVGTLACGRGLDGEGGDGRVPRQGTGDRVDGADLHRAATCASVRKYRRRYVSAILCIFGGT